MQLDKGFKIYYLFISIKKKSLVRKKKKKKKC